MMLPAHLVGLWATVNAALSLGLLRYGSTFPAVLHLVGSGLVAAFGVAALVSLRRRPEGPSLRIPYRSVAAAATGVFAVIVALGLVFGWFMFLFAPYPLVVALVMVRSERVPASAVPDDGHRVLHEPQPVAVHRPPTTREVRTDALETAHRRRRARRGEAT